MDAFPQAVAEVLGQQKKRELSLQEWPMNMTIQQVDDLFFVDVDDVGVLVRFQ